MTIRKAAQVTIIWENGDGQTWTDVQVDVFSNAPGPLAHPERPNTDYLQIVLPQK